jgi:hypothetical protein
MAVLECSGRVLTGSCQVTIPASAARSESRYAACKSGVGLRQGCSGPGDAIKRSCRASVVNLRLPSSILCPVPLNF